MIENFSKTLKTLLIYLIKYKEAKEDRLKCHQCYKMRKTENLDTYLKPYKLTVKFEINIITKYNNDNHFIYRVIKKE